MHMAGIFPELSNGAQRRKRSFLITINIAQTLFSSKLRADPVPNMSINMTGSPMTSDFPIFLLSFNFVVYKVRR